MTTEEDRVHQRADAISDSLRKIDNRAQQTQAIVQGPGTRQLKHWRLVQIADEISQQIQPHTPCRKGCAACCHIALPISRSIALLLSATSGRKLDEKAGAPITPEVLYDLREGNIKRYYGKPCPFLDGATQSCSIYEDRPITCRIHHSLADTAAPCDLKDPGAKIPRVDMQWVDQMGATLDFNDRWADIRDFFPEARCDDRA